MLIFLINEKHSSPQIIDPRRRRNAFIALAVWAAILYLAYSPILTSFFFVGSDFDFMNARGLKSLWYGYSWWDWSPRSPNAPLAARAVYLALHHFLGAEGSRYAAFCVALHAVNTSSVYRLSRRAAKHREPAAWAALFFTILPASVFAVANLASSLRQVLGTFCALLALLLVLSHVEKRSPLRYAAAVASFLIGLQFHELVVTAPCLMGLWLWISAERTPRSILEVLWPFAGIATGYAIFEYRIYLLGIDKFFLPGNYHGGIHAMANVFRIAGTLISPSENHLSWRWAAFLMPVFVLTALGLSRVPRRLVLLSLGSLALALSPFLPIHELSFADCGKYAYFASAFFCMFLGFAVWKSTVRFATAICALALAGGWTYQSRSICRYESEERQAEKACLEQVVERLCGPSSGGGAAHVLWPKAGMVWVTRSRIENYVGLRCAGRSSGVVLQTEPGPPTNGSSMIVCGG